MMGPIDYVEMERSSKQRVIYLAWTRGAQDVWTLVPGGYNGVQW